MSVIFNQKKPAAPAPVAPLEEMQKTIEDQQQQITDLQLALCEIYEKAEVEKDG